MSRYGLLIDIDACTGCHSCEVSCKLDKDLPTGVYGIKLIDDKPFQISEEVWEYKHVPIPTVLCDLCVERTQAGKVPSCVLHCCAHCMEYGTIAELSKLMEELPRRAVLHTIAK